MNSRGNIWVYDDGAVKGVIYAEDGEIKKVFVESVLHNKSIGCNILCQSSVFTLYGPLKKTNAPSAFMKGMDFMCQKVKNMRKIQQNILFGWNGSFCFL